jgi:8-oxo-dGTP pyrophosphatase MutT (NUDIX family)
MTVPTERRAARVLLLDADGRILLQQCFDPSAPDAGSWWNTSAGAGRRRDAGPGGARELYEETGLRVTSGALGPVVHQRRTAFDVGGSSYRQSEEYFLLRADVFDAAPTVPSELELVAVLGTRWWTREELRSTQERVYPEELVEVLERLGA